MYIFVGENRENEDFSLVVKTEELPRILGQILRSGIDIAQNVCYHFIYNILVRARSALFKELK